VIDTATNQVVDTIGVQAPVDIAVGPENPAFTPPPTATPTQSQPPSPIATEPQPGCCDYSQSGHAGCAAIPAVVDISQCFGSGGMPRGGPDSGVFCNALTGMCEVNATATPTPTPTAPSEDTTPSLTPSNAVTPSPSPSSTPTDTVTPGGRCPGDCDGDGAVTIEDVVTLVTIALDTAPLTACEPGDANQDGAITVEEVLKAVGHALSSCGGN
jgi:hypothetical protein